MQIQSTNKFQKDMTIGLSTMSLQCIKELAERSGYRTPEGKD